MTNVETFEANPRAVPGANLPPDVRAGLVDKYAPILKLADELMVAAKDVPTKIDDDETQAKAADLMRKMRDCELDLGKSKDFEKKPLEDDVKTIKATFDNPADRLEARRKEIKAVAKDYTDRKDAAEKARLEEIAKKKREEEQEALKLAAAAEEARNQASKAVDQYEADINAARIARASAQGAVEVADADVQMARAKIARIKADGFQMKADYANKAKNKEEIDDAERTQRREKYEADLETAKKELSAFEELLDAAKTEAAEAKRIEQENAEKLKAAQKDVRVATSDAKQHFQQAVRSDRAATVVEKQSDGPGLGGVKSEYGTRQTAARTWYCEITDVSLLPLDKLRHLIDVDALRIAARKWMLNQPPTEEARRMPGTSMGIDTIAVTSS